MFRSSVGYVSRGTHLLCSEEGSTEVFNLGCLLALVFGSSVTLFFSLWASG